MLQDVLPSIGIIPAALLLIPVVLTKGIAILIQIAKKIWYVA